MGLRLALRLGDTLGVVEGVHRLALLPCWLLHGGRMRLVRCCCWRVSLTLLARRCT